MEKRKRLKFRAVVIAVNAMVAALYFAMTVAGAPISYGMVQFRISEVLVLLAFVDPFYAPGLIIGCFMANLFGPGGIIDAIFGTLASTFAIVMIIITRKYYLLKFQLSKRDLPNTGYKVLGEKRALAVFLTVASLWTSVSAIIIAFELIFFVGIGETFWPATFFIALGEFVVVTLISVPLFMYLITNKDSLDALKIRK